MSNTIEATLIVELLFFFALTVGGLLIWRFTSVSQFLNTIRMVGDQQQEIANLNRHLSIALRNLERFLEAYLSSVNGENQPKRLVDEAKALLKEHRKASYDFQWRNGTRQAHYLLVTRIRERFSLEELDEVAFEMGCNPDDLPGDTLRARSRSLVIMAKNRGELDRLMRVLKKLRPRLEW